MCENGQHSRVSGEPGSSAEAASLTPPAREERDVKPSYPRVRLDSVTAARHAPDVCATGRAPAPRSRPAATGAVHRVLAAVAAGERDPAALRAGQKRDHAGVAGPLRFGQHHREGHDPVGRPPGSVRLGPAHVIAVPAPGRRAPRQPGPSGVTEPNAGHAFRIARPAPLHDEDVSPKGRAAGAVGGDRCRSAGAPGMRATRRWGCGSGRTVASARRGAGRGAGGAGSVRVRQPSRCDTCM